MEIKTDNNGSMMGALTNFIMILPNKIAVQFNAYSSKCNERTSSFSDSPFRSLKTVNPVTIKQRTARTNHVFDVHDICQRSQNLYVKPALTICVSK